MTPRDLPGLYWDHEKQRYFPLSSRHVRSQSAAGDSPQQANQDVPAPDSIPIERRLTSYHALSGIRSVIRTVRKDALFHQIQASQVLLTDKITSTVIPQVDSGFLSAFQTRPSPTEAACAALPEIRPDGSTLLASVMNVKEQLVLMDGNPSSTSHPRHISSIAVSDTACVATSFVECKLLYAPLDNPVQGTHVLSFARNMLYDIWSADLKGSRLALGAHNQAVVIEDIAVSTSLQHLHTRSDVLALVQHENILYAGLRNGGIFQSDARLQGSCSFSLLDTVRGRRSSITALKHLRDHQLLVSFIDGGISTFDLRFPIETPSMTFTGNWNTYTVGLPLAIDPYERFLFATGEDKRIRLWSLNTGGAALHPEATSMTNQTVFQQRFEHRVAALQVVQEREGLCLWVASGTEICKYSLGHHSGIGT